MRYFSWRGSWGECCRRRAESDSDFSQKSEMRQGTRRLKYLVLWEGWDICDATWSVDPMLSGTAD